MKSFYRSVLALACTIACTSVWAQMPHDAIYMGKKQICIAGMYGQSTWSNYWEGTLKRENLNIGVHTTRSIAIMPAIGISRRVNVILNLPYVWTSASAGNLMGQKGIQDLSAWLKVKAVAYKGLALHAVLGGTLPIGNYVPDFLPMSIGMQARTASGRIIASYKHPGTGLYLTTHATYNWRSNIKTDRDSYLAYDRVHDTNQASVPNAYDAAVRLGVQRKVWQTEVFAERFACIDGDNIRRNDMPFPTNKTEATQIGWYGKVQPRNIGMNARAVYVTNGFNAGQSTSFMVGLLYQFGI